ncbi:MAG: homoserine dehydrogenase [Alphaproteobacteria bacterium]|nr:homoserine dehydrogenase [Alphaproteobacteria bacterium]
MSSPLRIGIAGLGTVGRGTLQIIISQAKLIEQRCGKKIEVVGVSARNKHHNRGIDISHLQWFDDPMQMASDPKIDVVVEMIGGSEGVAKNLVEASLKAGKSVVTANKALIAHHGIELAKLAEKSGAVLAFEAAVAGGIPIIKALRDGLAANQFSRIAGIMNGTCNYILTAMWEQKRDFDEVLADAMAKGYAEADPSFDVDGIDTAHKLAILTSLAYACAPAIGEVYIEGIRRVTLRDMEFAAELGYVIKLLGITATTEGGILQRVHPCMVPTSSPLGSVSGVYNAVQVEGDSVGKVFFEGRGAGDGPTGSSVVADIMDIARGTVYKPFTLPVASLAALPFAKVDALQSSYYLRLSVTDKPGVLAEVTAIFKNENISLRSFIQRGHAPGEAVELVLTTHEALELSMQKAIAAIAKLDIVRAQPTMIRIENI